MWEWVKNSIKDYYKRKFYKDAKQILGQTINGIYDTHITRAQVNIANGVLYYAQVNGYNLMPLSISIGDVKHFSYTIRVLQAIFDAHPELSSLPRHHVKFVQTLCKNVYILKCDDRGVYQHLLLFADEYEQPYTNVSDYYSIQLYQYVEEDHYIIIPLFGIAKDTFESDKVLTTEIKIFAATEKEITPIIIIDNLRQTLVRAHHLDTKNSGEAVFTIEPIQPDHKQAHIVEDESGFPVFVEQSHQYKPGSYNTFLLLPQLTPQMSQATTLQFKTTYTPLKIEQIPGSQEERLVADNSKTRSMLHKVDIYITNFASGQ